MHHCSALKVGLLLRNAHVFADFYDLVAGEVLQSLHETARPANLDGISLGGIAQSEMQAEVTSHFARCIRRRCEPPASAGDPPRGQ